MKTVTGEQLTVTEAKEQHERLEVHRSSLVETRMGLDWKAEQLEKASGRAYCAATGRSLKSRLLSKPS